MVRKLIKKIKSNKITNKIYMALRKIVYPIFSGYLLYMIKYCIKVHSKEVNMLNNIGITDVKLYKSKSWRIGNEKDKVFRRYYEAIYNGNKCFIKISENDLTTKNEIVIQKKLSLQNYNFTPKVYLFNENFYNNTCLIVEEFFNSLNQIDSLNQKNEVDKMCGDFLIILEELEKIGLVHADINKGNLMLNDNHLMLIDYGISKFINEDNEINYYYRPGTFFVNDGNKRVYDDAYSFIELIKSLKLEELACKSPYYKKIAERIGKVNFTVEVKK